MEKYAKSVGKRIIEVPINDFSDDEYSNAPSTSKKKCVSSSYVPKSIENQESLEGINLDDLYSDFFDSDSPETMKDKLPCKKFSLSAKLPTRGTIDSAGLDLYSDEEKIIQPQSLVKIKTGLKCAIPSGYYGKIEDKSSIVTKQFLKTVGGVIDADYRGEIIVCLFNLHPKKTFLITKGQAIAQMIIHKYENFIPIFVEKLSSTDRGEKGFGSTTKM